MIGSFVKITKDMVDDLETGFSDLKPILDFYNENIAKLTNEVHELKKANILTVSDEILVDMNKFRSYLRLLEIKNRIKLVRNKRRKR